MPKKCAVLGCSTNRDYYEPGLHFFHIPREDEDLQERWLQVIGRGPEWKIPNFPNVCEKHFSPEQITSTRTLADKTIPILNLPDLSEDNPQSNDKQPKDPKRGNIQRKKRVTRRKRIEAPELVLVRSDDVLIFDACCRLCEVELKVTEGLEIADVRPSELVRESIWEVCLLESDSAGNNEQKICADCWGKMQEFENFVETCHQHQRRLIRALPVPVETSNFKEELEQNDSELTGEQVQTEFSNNSEMEIEEQSSNLPPLDGLTIDEMLDILDKIPTPRSKHDQVNLDEECWDCGKMFPNRSQRKEHRKICTAIGSAESLRNRSHTCEICSRPFNSRHGYRTHLQKKHKNDPAQEKNTSEELKRLQSKKRLQCPLCPDRFQQMHQLKYHLKTHKIKSLITTETTRKSKNSTNQNNKTCYCELCDKTFQNASYLDLHMKFHKRQRDFECDQCDKRFFIRNDLKNHKMTVHEAHTFLCGVCGKTYGTRCYFNRHMLTHNTDPNLKPFKCSYCNESFYTALKLKYHVTRHTGEKMYGCEICGQAFRFRHLLTHHKINKHGMKLDGLLLAKVDAESSQQMDVVGEENEEVMEEQVLDENFNVDDEFPVETVVSEVILEYDARLPNNNVR